MVVRLETAYRQVRAVVVEAVRPDVQLPLHLRYPRPLDTEMEDRHRRGRRGTDEADHDRRRGGETYAVDPFHPMYSQHHGCKIGMSPP
jgi:hypothetical protein